jgi:hypothetical protein
MDNKVLTYYKYNKSADIDFNLRTQDMYMTFTLAANVVVTDNIILGRIRNTLLDKAKELFIEYHIYFDNTTWVRITRLDTITF